MRDEQGRPGRIPPGSQEARIVVVHDERLGTITAMLDETGEIVLTMLG